MKEDKIVGGKVYSFFDWVWRLMVLNMLTIICSIGIITICPAICACFRTIKETKENYTPKIFKPYFNNFKYLFRDTWGFSIALVVFVVVCGYGYLWYDGVVGATLASGEKLDKIWLMIAIFSIVIISLGGIMLLMAFIQLPMVINYFYYGYKDSARLCFYMAFKYIITTLIESAIVIVSVILFINAIFIYSLIPLCLFFGISLPQYLKYLVSRKFYVYVSEYQDGDVEDYDYMNKTVNRETYEDDKKIIKKEGEENND